MFKAGNEAHMLDSNKVGTDERNMINLAECTDYPSVVNARNKYSEEVSQERWLFLQVKCQRLVVTENDVSK